MNNALMYSPEDIQSLRNLIEQAESRRDESSLDGLRTYMNNRHDLFPKAQTLAEGLYERLINYIGSANQQSKRMIRQKYQALWETFIEENKAGVVGMLLIKEIIVSALLMEYADEKLSRLFSYAGSKEGRLMESIHSRYLRSLQMFQKINGKLPSIELTQINIQN